MFVVKVVRLHSYSVLKLFRRLCCSGVLGPLGTSLGPLGVVLGCLGCLLGPLGRLSGASWAALGASWEGLGGLLGRSWGLLERSWGLLGRSCGLCCRKLIFKKNQSRFWANFEVQKGSPKGPKWSQKRSKIGTKIEDEKRNCLGPSLGRFWTILVTVLGSKIIKIILFLKVS